MGRKNNRVKTDYERETFNTREFLKGDKVDKLLKDISKPKYKKYDYKDIKVKKGEVYYVTLDSRTKLSGSEQAGVKPCVIVQNDVGNKYSTTTIVAVITSESKKGLPTHIKINLGEDGSTIMCEQIFTINKKRIHYLDTPCYTLSKEEIKKLNEALKISLGVF